MNEKAKQVIDKLLNAFKTGEVEQAMAVVVLPRLDVPSSDWSLSNRLLVFLSGSSDARGVKQWRETGRYPRKGSKALYIVVPQMKKKVDENSGDEQHFLIGFRVAPVFRVEDTDGDPLEAPDLRPQQMPPLYDVAKDLGIHVSWQSYQQETYGYYAPNRNEIVLATHDERVFFHELAHVAHHKVLGKIKVKQDWQQEVVAELTAATLARLYGKQISDSNSYRYITQYAEREGLDAHRACLAVIADVGKCLDLIIKLKEAPLLAA